MNHETIEKLYDITDEMAMILVEHANLRYLDALCAASANIMAMDVLQEVETEIEIKLFVLGKELAETEFAVEEVRKALQLALLKGMKADNVPLDNITPDSIGLLIGHLVGKFFKDFSKLTIADLTCGTGNLLTTTLNTLETTPASIYGADIDYQLLQLAKMMADMQDHDVQFFHQSSARAMAVSPVDVIIGNLPVDGKVEAADKDSKLAQAGCNFLPYLLVENHLNYLTPGGYAIYVIGNDFFSQEHAAKFHEVLTGQTDIGMLLQLPTNLFKDESQQKSIFVVRKHGEGLSKVQEVLVGNFPDFGNIEEFRAMLTKVEKWVKMNEWFGNELEL